MSVTTRPASIQPRLVLNPSAAVIRCNDDEVVASLGSRARSTHRIQDAGGHRKLADFVLAFTTPVTPDSVADRLGLDDAVAAEFTQHLLDGHVLIAEEESRYSYLVSGLGLDGIDTEVAVAVVGGGRIADAVCRQFGSLLGREVAPAGEIAEAFESNDFVVVCPDQVDPGMFYDADELSRALDKPWHLAYCDGFELMVGPTFVPGESPNYYDFDAMDESARVMRMQYLYAKSALPEAAQHCELPAFVADLAASYITMALTQHLWGRGSFLEGYLLRIDLERMQLVRDRVLRLPRNPVDMGVRSDLRHPFL